MEEIKKKWNTFHQKNLNIVNKFPEYKKEAPSSIDCNFKGDDKGFIFFPTIEGKESQLEKNEVNNDFFYENNSFRQACLLGNKKDYNIITKEIPQLKINEIRITPKKRTPLHLACLGSSFEIYQDLIKNKADVFLKDIDGNSCLHFACLSGGSLKIVEDLVEKKLDVNLQNIHGETPFHKACRSGNFKIFKFLLNSGASISLKNKDGQEPFHCVPYAKKEEFEKYIHHDSKLSPSVRHLKLSPERKEKRPSSR